MRTNDRSVLGRAPGPALVVMVVIVVIMTVVVALWLTDRVPGDAGPAGTAGPAASPTTSDTGPGPTEGAAEVSFAVVGDSITEADSPDIDAAEPGAGSWAFHAADERAVFVGGWARSGATTAQMADNVAELRADCLVILAGTNDIAQGVPFDISADHLRSIVSTAGLGTVIVSAIPPFDPDPRAAVTYNRELSALAAAEGWIFTDPMAGVRAGDRFRPSLSGDGVHPTQEGARLIGEHLRAEVLAVAPTT